MPVARPNALLAILTAACLGLFAGCGGSGSSDSPGSGGGTSAGNAHVVFQIGNGKSYCTTSNCGSIGGPGIKDASGKALRLSAGDCYTPCDTCEMLPCPGAACQEAHGVAITGGELKWDGHHFEQGTCNGSVSCFRRVFAPPGKYTARMCATPGDLVDAPPSQLKQCQASGPQECVDVDFDYPSTAPVTAQWP